MGQTKEGIPALRTEFSTTVDELMQGGTLQGITVQLLLNGQPISEHLTPTPLRNHSCIVDFGVLRIGGKCSVCISGACLPGRSVTRLEDGGAR